MSFLRTLGASSALSILAACNIDWTVQPAAPDAAAPGAEGGAGLVDLDGGSSGNDATAFDARAVDASDAGGPSCSPTQACSGGLHCAYADHFCGSGGPGVCRATSPCAGAPAETVCGCDANVYASRCAAIRAGADPSIQAPCAVPGGTFRCGYVFCANGDFCVVRGGGATYECKPAAGCVLGCACPGVLTECAGGSCGKEGGQNVVRCP